MFSTSTESLDASTLGEGGVSRPAREPHHHDIGYSCEPHMPFLNRSADNAEEARIKAGGLIEPPRRLNVVEFVLSKHTVISVFYRSLNTASGPDMRERLFYLIFQTACAAAIAMEADIKIQAEELAHNGHGVFAGLGDFFSSLIVSVSVVTPLTALVQSWYGKLDDMVPCVKSLTKNVVLIEEVLLALFVFQVYSFAFFNPAAMESNAVVVGQFAVVAQYLAEFPRLLLQYFFYTCCTCCGCCISKADASYTRA